ncbi:MAG: Hsp20/alpha crystallin family protein [Armatimonadetes bacterium]|nr:Hsp20/alpha crystallin family protein [Armatimonadota bacterium]
MARRDADEWFFQLGQELSRISDELARVRPSLASGSHWEPRVDVLEEPHRLLIRIELAGVRSEDVALSFQPESHSLVVRGVKLSDGHAGDSEARYHQLEIPTGDFRREIKLPSVSIQTDEIRAQLRNGILLVSIPRNDHRVQIRPNSQEAMN